VESHRRAGSAVDQGFFKAQIVPIEIKVKREKVPFVTDETVRHGTTVEKLAKLPTVFDPEGTVTPGNASSINDAAAALVLADGDYAQKRGLKPIGRLVGYAYAGVDPKYMGIGPVPAVQKLLKKSGFALDDIDVFEVNEAFAAQALAVCRELNLPAERTNPNGSGISLGHPLGATGAILTVKAPAVRTATPDRVLAKPRRVISSMGCSLYLSLRAWKLALPFPRRPSTCSGSKYKNAPGPWLGNREEPCAVFSAYAGSPSP